MISGSEGALQKSLDNVQVLTGTDGHLNQTLANLDHLTTQVLADNRIGKTLANLEDTSAHLNGVVSSLAPRVDIITDNLQQATNTLKSQPWRLIWPSTKHYPSPAPRQARRQSL